MISTSINNSVDFESLEDSEIIELINSGHDEGVDYLLNKYKNLVRKKARTLFLIGADTDDLIQEGMIGLYRAIMDYDVSRDYSFINFAATCIERQIYNAIKSANRLKNTPLNTYISIYHPLAPDNSWDSQGKPLGEVLKSNFNSNPEDILISRENVSILEQAIEKILSPFEKTVVKLYIDGHKNSYIAEKTGKSPKAVDNALQRAKKKLIAAVGN